jgi:hypothetical protein
MSEKKSDDDVVPVGETKQAQQEPEKEMTAEEIKLQQLRKKYPVAMGLDSIKPRKYKRKKDQYRSFSSIMQNEIDEASRTFVTLYSMYERKPFLEPLEDQETLENVTAEITFGISDDAFDVKITVAGEDQWLVPQANVGISFEEGFCEVSLEPVKDQYGSVDVNIEVHDVGGVSKHEFSLNIVQDKTKIEQQDDGKGKKKKKRRRTSFLVNPAAASKSSGTKVEDTGEDFEDRDENPRAWNTMHVCDWMLEVGLSKFAKTFASKEVTGAQMLNFTPEELRDSYGVAKTRDRDKFVKFLIKLREQSEIAEHSERERKMEEEAREKLRLEKEARRAVARGEGDGGGGGGSSSSSGGVGDDFRKSASEGLDPWLCGHAPRITRGECGDVDMDAYGIVYELLKIKTLDGTILHDSTFIDLCCEDGRYVMSAALGLPFLRCIGLQSIEQERVAAQRFVQRYNTRFRKNMPKQKQRQRIAVIDTLPEHYDRIDEATALFLHWPILEDLFYKKKDRFYYWTDLTTILNDCRKGCMLVVTDDSVYSPFEEDDDDELIHAEARPGNVLDGWTILRGPTTHHFSKGERKIYVYKKAASFDSGTLELLEDERDEEADDQKRLQELEEDATE